MTGKYLKRKPFTQANINHSKRDMQARKFVFDLPPMRTPITREAVLQMIEDGTARAYKTGGKTFRWIVTNAEREHDPEFPFVSRRNEGEEIDD